MIPHTTTTTTATDSHDDCTRTRADGCKQALITETENLLEKWKHPDPYRPPTAPGGALLYLSRIHIRTGRGNGNANICAGSKYERNLPVPIIERECCFLVGKTTNDALLIGRSSTEMDEPVSGSGWMIGGGAFVGVHITH